MTNNPPPFTYGPSSTPDAQPPQMPFPPQQQGGDKKLKTGHLVAIIVGAFVVLAAIIVAVFVFLASSASNNEPVAQPEPTNLSPDDDQENPSSTPEPPSTGGELSNPDNVLNYGLEVAPLGTEVALGEPVLVPVTSIDNHFTVEMVIESVEKVEDKSVFDFYMSPAAVEKYADYEFYYARYTVEYKEGADPAFAVIPSPSSWSSTNMNFGAITDFIPELAFDYPECNRAGKATFEEGVTFYELCQVIKVEPGYEFNQFIYNYSDYYDENNADRLNPVNWNF